ncbi:DNA topoisomerase I [Candidatus Bathycorpusculum sp.]|uniref:DNA topoisomerase I n=1 Tax=Candidatus Bathycorpusculum sp. TaxID=2994959 RepID=UPI0028339C96|nr:DNA topoisomerase I [Candidatus Termitimicrobium sp.]MCL2431435.1 DNA topoisomerase I [Candidatus Termitimicrobium sp.]
MKYTLIVTEKPDAANRIATALDEEGKPKKSTQNGVPYYTVYRGGAIVVVPAIGHLYTINSKKKNCGYPVFDYQWVPRYQAEKKAKRVRVWLKVISDLAKNAETFVDGCDFDIEGSIIGYTILKYACGEKQDTAKRMKYSTLTNEELQTAYDNLLPHLDFALVEAGLTRHEIDWLYGINLSRALTEAVKATSGQYATLSTGRVQGPTLQFLEEREKDIQSFVPTPYWKLTAKIGIDGKAYAVEYEPVLETLAEAKMIQDAAKTKTGTITSVEIYESTVNPPIPFDLGSLQREAYKLFRYSPMRTSKTLQRLYLDALISYPRTSSQKLPSVIGYGNILKKLQKAPAYTKQATELLVKSSLKPNEGKKIDPAHPAIYPTGNLAQKPLDTASKNIFDLTVKRFLAVFAEPAVRQNVNVTISLNDYPFRLSLTRTLAEGWFRFYQPYVWFREDVLPPLVEGYPVEVSRVSLKGHYTQPPPRYNPRSLLLEMEKKQIGTKATRAAIIQTLHDRRYLNGTDQLAVNDLGFGVIGVLERYCPTVVSPEMTRILEEKMDDIQQGKENKQKVLADTVETLKQITTELKNKENLIGIQLSLALTQARLDDRTVGACPKCGYGQLVILRSKKSKKRFVGCTGFFEGKCNMAYPLPQIGTVKPCGDICKKCGAPVVTVYLRGKKPWTLCLDPQCTPKSTDLKTG